MLKRITVRGSIVGARNGLREVPEFAGEGKVVSHFNWDKLEKHQWLFDRMKTGGRIDGRLCLRSSVLSVVPA